jgi:hypothetical protein
MSATTVSSTIPLSAYHAIRQYNEPSVRVLVAEAQVIVREIECTRVRGLEYWWEWADEKMDDVRGNGGRRRQALVQENGSATHLFQIPDASLHCLVQKLFLGQPKKFSVDLECGNRVRRVGHVW